MCNLFVLDVIPIAIGMLVVVAAALMVNFFLNNNGKKDKSNVSQCDGTDTRENVQTPTIWDKKCSELYASSAYEDSKTRFDKSAYEVLEKQMMSLMKQIYRNWQKTYRDDIPAGTTAILQLLLDLTGYEYQLTSEDSEGNMLDIVRKKIIRANFQEKNSFGNTVFLNDLNKFLKLMIVEDRQELLQNNIWLNKTIRLLMAFCESNDDKCKMVAGYLSSTILVLVAVVQQHVLQDLERIQLEEDSEKLQEAEKRERYISKIGKLLINNVDAGCRYVTTLPLIAESYCEFLETHPMLIEQDSSLLEVLAKLLQHQHCKMYSTIANCLKNLLNPETLTSEMEKIIVKFFLESIGKRFVQYMMTFKSCERVAMEVIAAMQRQNCGRSIFENDLTDKVRQYMFSVDEVVRSHAIDFHVSICCTPDDDDNKNGEILLDILKLYERYEHSSLSLKQLITDLWKLDFFDDWGLVFNMLSIECSRNDNIFMITSIVLVITQCHTLMLSNLQEALEPKAKKVDRTRLRNMLKGFLTDYPRALQDCIPHKKAYIALLHPANSECHTLLQHYNITHDDYYEALFAVLSTVLKTATNFDMVQKSLITIRGYWNIVIDMEEMWIDILNELVKEFVDTRTRFTSKNIGQDHVLTTKYVTSMARLAALLELDYELYAHAAVIKKIVFNDFRLLDKMNLNSNQISMFYRLYKCIFYVIVKELPTSADSGFSDAFANQSCSGQRLKKRMQELLRALVKLLIRFDDTLDTCVHIFTTLCDMLLLSQIDVVELHQIGHSVEMITLDKMAKYLLHYLFSKQYDWQEDPVTKQKLIMNNYINLYTRHKSLPRITDTHYIVANFAVDTPLEEQLKQLMKVLHKIDPVQFAEVICLAVFQLLLSYRSETSVKQFFKKLQSFFLTELPVDNKEDCSSLIANVVEKILNHMMNVMSNEDNKATAIRMLKLLEPLLPHVPMEDRLSLEHLLLLHPDFEHFAEQDRKAVKRFVRHLKK
ncbi:uncharacterized protein LOC128740315 [Sabethes cyaneus]|uniref:uncharacterized protein LOC128740315 n=1 Tax=Sabethes cyaneus TaxID=53552 RepID=UPI00237DD2AD|nr:uncharacterized protein LOC128740315 [Sabethes cyaneus]